MSWKFFWTYSLVRRICSPSVSALLTLGLFHLLGGGLVGALPDEVFLSHPWNSGFSGQFFERWSFPQQK
jgi:hypothetical protein